MTIERFGVWVREMGVIPKGYGVAWYDPLAAQAFCMRAPLNRIFGAFRMWYLEIRRPCHDDPVLLAYGAGHRRGVSEGRDHGYETGLRHARIAWEAGQRP